MGITEKGKKGFQSTPEDEKLNKRINVYLTNDEFIELKKYCSTKGESQSNIIRSLILDVL